MRPMLLGIFCLNVMPAAEPVKPPYQAQEIVRQMDMAILKARQDAIAKLDKVISDITKTGNLDAAVVVKELRAGIQQQIDASQPENPAAAIVGRWTTSYGAIREYLPNGTAIHTNGDKGRWMIKGDQLITTWDGGSVDTFDLPIKNDTLHGRNKKGPVAISRAAKDK